MLPEQRTLKIKAQRHRTRLFLMTFIRMDRAGWREKVNDSNRKAGSGDTCLWREHNAKKAAGEWIQS